MRYLHSYQYVFISPKWLNNLGLGVVCELVPIIGHIVLMGYHFEMIEAMIRDGEENYPDFDANRLFPYLKRGVWPFVISLLAGIPLLILLMVFGIVFAVAVLGGHGDPSYWVLFLFLVIFVLTVLFGFAVMPLLGLPLEIRAGLTNSLRAAFSREFYVDFVRRCWKELLFAQLFVFASGSLLLVVGVLLCCLGTAPAQAFMMFARSHLLYQIYMKYLERGGIPPVVKEQKLQV
jgi:hypothetical protein